MAAAAAAAARSVSGHRSRTLSRACFSSGASNKFWQTYSPANYGNTVVIGIGLVAVGCMINSELDSAAHRKVLEEVRDDGKGLREDFKKAKDGIFASGRKKGGE